MGACAPAPLSTKGTRLSGCEEASSGAFLAVYRCSDGVLEYSMDVETGSSLVLRDGVEYDIFLLGNLNYVRRDDGTAQNLRQALGEDFPTSAAELASIVYRLDGGAVGTTLWRRESAADIPALGIPFAGRRTHVTASQLRDEGGLSFPEARYLFAKVCITVDHSLLDGGVASAQDWFRNVSLSVRQANACLQPFSSSVPYAESSADILGTDAEPLSSCFDYDDSMVNGSRVQYTLYLPANAQGCLLEGNADPSRKNPEGLAAAGKGEKAGLCTYVEFVGAVSSDAGGFRGGVRYRFFLGGDACSDFSVLGGRVYDITLTLSVEGVFGGAWKVSGFMVDERTLALYRDAARSDAVTYGGTLSLGAERPLEVFVRCTDGAGRDLLLHSSYDASAGWTPSGLDDAGLRCSFWEAGDGDAAWLSACGIGASWDASRRCLVLRVEDELTFRVHVGERRLLEVYAVPGDGTCWRSFTLELVDVTSAVAGGYVFAVSPAYVGTSSVLLMERRDYAPDGPEWVSVQVDGAYIGDYGLAPDGEVDLGVLPEGEHEVVLELTGGGVTESIWVEVQAEVCPKPTLSLSYGQRSLTTTCWKNVRDADGVPYVAHRRSWGRIWVEVTPQGRWESVAFRTVGSFFSACSSSGRVVDLESTGYGEGELLVDITLGRSTCTVSVPYICYEEVVFRAAEEHGWAVLIFNNVSVGWQSLVNFTTGRVYASVTWSLRLSLLCSDGTRASGSWGPFQDVSAPVADGSSHLRDFHDEFKRLRQEFESGHSLTDAERLEGEMSFRVTFGSRYYLANVSGATFADFSGMVEAVCETPSAHPLLTHWAQNSSRFYGYR